MNGILDGLKPVQEETSTTQQAYRLEDVRRVPGVVVTEPHPEAYLAVHQDPDRVAGRS